MSSVVVYGNEFPGQSQAGAWPVAFDKTILVEGDSWMDRSNLFEGSLLDQLARLADRNGANWLFINLSTFGHTMRRMGEQADGDFAAWAGAQTYDAVLLSAGGNDLIDAVADSPPGQGLLRDVHGQPGIASVAQCWLPDRFTILRDAYMTPNFRRIYQILRAGPNAHTPVLLNRYDTPTARPATVWPRRTAWLSHGCAQNGIPPALWQAVTQHGFAQLAQTIDSWAAMTHSAAAPVKVVPTVGTLTPAAPGSTGSDQDWLNEIHPNRRGWKKLARVWMNALLALPGF
jgi:GDSL-like Lipase/Acylhydrolase family